MLRDNLAISDIGVIAYAGMPLTSPEGAVVGSFCAIDTKPRSRSQEGDPGNQVARRERLDG